MALAFLFGVAFGWVLWGARRGAHSDDADEGEAVVTAAAVGDAKEIGVIKAELQAVRSLLDQTDEQDADVTEQLSTLDETVKRANGRLKTILAAVKRAASRT